MNDFQISGLFTADERRHWGYTPGSMRYYESAANIDEDDEVGGSGPVLVAQHAGDRQLADWSIVPGWMARGECAKHPDVEFFSDKAGHPHFAACLELCAACTVRTACREYALSNKIRWGVWGGLTAQQRADLLNPPQEPRKRPGRPAQRSVELVPAPASPEQAPSRRPSVGRFAVYRIFDTSGQLLYVGMSKNLAGRLRTHSEKSWGESIADIKITWFTDKEQAAKAEAAAIANEAPLHNITASPRGVHNKHEQGGRMAEVIVALEQLGQATSTEVQRHLGDDQSRSFVNQVLGRLKDRGVVVIVDHRPSNSRWGKAAVYALAAEQRRAS